MKDDGPVILRNVKGRATHVVLPAAEWQRLREQTEAAEVKGLLKQDTTIPHAQAVRVAEGENLLKVLREWRNLSQAQLAGRSGVPQPTIAALERRRRKGTLAQWRALAKALNLQLETLTDWD